MYNLDYSLKPTDLDTVKECLFKIENVFANCATHPNSLLCHDQRLETFFNSYSQVINEQNSSPQQEEQQLA